MIKSMQDSIPPPHTDVWHATFCFSQFFHVPSSQPLIFLILREVPGHRQDNEKKLQTIPTQNFMQNDIFCNGEKFSYNSRAVML